jgi:hypothetical protein
VAYRLPGGRVELPIEGQLEGLRVEVEPIGAWAIYRAAVSLVALFFAADGPAAEFAALRDLNAFFVDEAQPTWDIVDHRGPVPATAQGMLRLPLALVLNLVNGWTDTLATEDEKPATAVDAIVPPGDLRDQLNDALAKKRAEAA